MHREGKRLQKEESRWWTWNKCNVRGYRHQTPKEKKSREKCKTNIFRKRRYGWPSSLKFFEWRMWHGASVGTKKERSLCSYWQKGIKRRVFKSLCTPQAIKRTRCVCVQGEVFSRITLEVNDRLKYSLSREKGNVWTKDTRRIKEIQLMILILTNL